MSKWMYTPPVSFFLSFKSWNLFLKDYVVQEANENLKHVSFNKTGD